MNDKRWTQRRDIERKAKLVLNAKIINLLNEPNYHKKCFILISSSLPFFKRNKSIEIIADIEVIIYLKYLELWEIHGLKCGVQNSSRAVLMKSSLCSFLLCFKRQSKICLFYTKKASVLFYHVFNDRRSKRTTNNWWYYYVR